LGTIATGTWAGLYTNTTTITSLGTIATGTWNGAYANSSVAAVAAGTYAGNTNITTLGTIATGTWNGATIAVTKGGTGLTTFASGDIIYASGSNTLAALAKGTSNYFLKMDGSGNFPAWSNTIDGGTP
jgi:hypothetical protein